MGAESTIWDVRMRIELTRFEVWGRTLGFLDEETGDEKASDMGDLQLLDMAEVLQVDSTRKLVRDILLSLQKTFEEFKEVARRYHLVQRPKQLDAEHGKSLDNQLKRIWTSTKDLGLHLILVVKDKDRVRSLIQELTELNNGLESVLSITQKAQSARSLASQVLNKYQNPEQLNLFLGPKISEDTPQNENDLSVIPKQHEALAVTANIKRMIAMSETSGVISFRNAEIPKDRFRLAIAPRRSSSILPWPISLAAYRSDNDESPPSSVLVEWRKPDRQSPGSKISMEELRQRRDHVVAVLHATSNLPRVAMPMCRVLDSIGWFTSTGQELGEKLELVGFASRLPSWADPRRPPVSLKRLLEQSIENGGKDTPSLRTRFKLAAALAQAIYQLQCSHWLHRALSSEQLLFFYDLESSELRLDAPFLAGLLYSRPDDQRVDDRVFVIVSEGNRGDRGPSDIYMHPGLMMSPRRYRRSDDVYSLGVILLEIALWEPATDYCDSVDTFHTSLHEAELFANKVFEAAKEELAAEVGELYQSAVIACLKGLRVQTDSSINEQMNGDVSDEDSSTSDVEMNEDAYDGNYDGEDPEYGLESDLLWKVIRQLEKLRV
jgi:hypothetical protein